MKITKTNYIKLLNNRIDYLADDLLTEKANSICTDDFDAVLAITDNFDDKTNSKKIQSVRDYYDNSSVPAKTDVAKKLQKEFPSVELSY